MSTILACTPELLSDIVADAGWTEVSRSKSLSLYCSIIRREEFLSELVSKARHLLEKGVVLPPLSPTFNQDDAEQLIAEYEFVLEVCDQLDIHTPIDPAYTKYRSCPPDQYDMAAYARERYWSYVEHIFSTKYASFGGGHGDWVKAWNRYSKDRRLCDVRADYCADRKPARRDEAWKFVFELTYKSRASSYRQRLSYECREAQKAGWFLVFDTCTLADDKVEAFVEKQTAIRDYTRSIGRMVRRAELGTQWGSATPEARKDISGCYKYFCVPEYGSKNGRLHFHILHFMKVLPLGAVDPNSNPISRAGRSIRKRRQLAVLQGRWPYGFNKPMCCRYGGDAFTNIGHLWPTDDQGVPVPNKPIEAVARYITKYVTKTVDSARASKLSDLGESISPHMEQSKLWSQQMNLRGLPTTTFRIRMSRGFGVPTADMSHLSTQAVRQLTRLPPKTASYQSLVKKKARRELRSRLGAQSVTAVMEAKPARLNLVEYLRNMIQQTEASSLASFMLATRPCLELADISDEALNWLKVNDFEYVDTTRVTFGSAK